MKKKTERNIFCSKLLSLDQLRASYKTLRNFLKDSKDTSLFDTYGTSEHVSKIFTYYPEEIKQTTFTKDLVEEGYRDVKTIEYTVISKDRMQYIQDIVSLCQKHNMSYTFFITPLSGQLLSAIHNDTALLKTLHSFKAKLSNITGYYDFLTHNEINDNQFYFGDTMHT